MARVELNIDLNRVEGDLEIALVLEDNVVVEARTVGRLYRGFEQIMLGRAPRDALVITPRVCGICGTAHLYSAVQALEQVWQITPPSNAVRIRNLCLMAEGIQNDLRQTFLFFAPDLCNQRYLDRPWFETLLKSFEPFKGDLYRRVLAITRRTLEIVAHFGGQWPHSSYMLPGGVTTPADLRRIVACRAIIEEVTAWYECYIIGHALEQWLELDSADQYWDWLSQPQHANSGLGLLTRCARDLGLHQLAQGTPHMLSFGSWPDPEGDGHLIRAGFYDGKQGLIESLDSQQINEHVRHSWFKPYQGGLHPAQGVTIPDFQPNSPDRYTWAKAPRYGDKVVQTGPLAELIMAGDALICDLYAKEGSSAWLRQFARVRRIAYELLFAQRMLQQMSQHLGQAHFISPSPSQERDGAGCGLIMAARGALGHWLEINQGAISRYQIITPSAWNASPRDSNGVPGHWEQSLVGVRVEDPDNPVEIGHVIRSHDPCLVCTVHMLDSGKRVRFAP